MYNIPFKIYLLSVIFFSFSFVGCGTDSPSSATNIPITNDKPIVTKKQPLSSDEINSLCDKVQKSSFETQKEYDNRINNIQPILVRQYLSYINGSGFSDVSYDSEKQQVTIKVPYLLISDTSEYILYVKPTRSTSWLPLGWELGYSTFNETEVTYDMDSKTAEKAVNNFYIQSEFSFNSNTINMTKDYSRILITGNAFNYKLYNSYTEKTYPIN